MSGSPRISDKELAQINAAAVTKEYRVQPHLGTRSLARGYVQLPIALG
jgi:V-type H+-transporting ATPase subunit B